MVEVGPSQAGEQSTPGTHAHPSIPDIVISGEPPPEVEAHSVPEERQSVSADVQEWLGDHTGDGVPNGDPIEQPASDTSPEPTDTPLEQDAHDSVASPTAATATPLPVSSEPNPDSFPEAEAPPQAPRQFPPPGTLVVVQGVVNTTDVPSSDNATSSSRRPSRSTTPRPPSAAAGRQGEPASGPRDIERHGTRNRLSSFINRTRPGDGRAADSASSNRNSAVSDISASAASHDTISAEESSIMDDQESIHDDHDVRPRPLSQGSIDVLGTLLRYARMAQYTNSS